MRVPWNGRLQDRRVSANASGARRGRLRRLGAGALLFTLISEPAAMAQDAAPKSGDPAPAEGAAEAPLGLPAPNWPGSPHRGVIDGWTGKPIPCRCRFGGKSFELGSVVCMTTHLGTVLTRCDIVGNNTSWMPSRQPCTPDAGT